MNVYLWDDSHRSFPLMTKTRVCPEIFVDNQHMLDEFMYSERV